jgi:hypothetical protein
MRRFGRAEVRGFGRETSQLAQAILLLDKDDERRAVSLAFALAHHRTFEPVLFPRALVPAHEGL